MSISEQNPTGNHNPTNPVDDPEQRKPQPGTLRGEIAALTARFEAADQRMKRAATIEVREAAEAERREAAGDCWANEADLADLLLLLLRICLRHQPAALEQYLVTALRSHLDEITLTIAQLESRR